MKTFLNIALHAAPGKQSVEAWPFKIGEVDFFLHARLGPFASRWVVAHRASGGLVWRNPARIESRAKCIAAATAELTPFLPQIQKEAPNFPVLNPVNLQDRTTPPRTVDTGNGEAGSQDRLTAAGSSAPAQKARRPRVQTTTSVAGAISRQSCRKDLKNA